MIRVLPLLLSLVLLAACASDDREQLVVYSPHGKELLEAYEAAFEAEHPDVDVVWLDMGAQDAYDRIRTERVNPQASLWWGAPQTLFMQAAAEGLLAPYTPTWVEAVPPEARDPEARWFGTYFTPEVVAYNTEALDSTAVPTDWDAMLDSAWADRIVIRSPLASGTMRTIYGAMILRQPTVEEGYRWLARLDQNTKAYTADPTQLYLKLARGEGDLTLWNMPDIALQRDENGYPFGYLVPAGGTPILVDAIAVVADAPNPERAQQFYEFVTTTDALIEQARAYHRIPARSDVPPDSLPGWMTALDLQPMPLDWARLATEGPDWMQYWDENIRGRGAEYLAEHGGE
ncbi:MAG: extracellular solute-binding protein [Rhodothermaceae bacterium]|nr:extracellular solute-binding protein [Rhodothermaceae bacterium]